MVYSIAWDVASPVGGTTPAADLDTELQNLKISIRERMNDLVGAGNWEADGVDPKTLAGAPTVVRGVGVISDPIVSTKVLGWTIIEDLDGIYNAGTNNFEIQSTGVYLVAMSCFVQVPGGGVTVGFDVRKNESFVLDNGQWQLGDSGLVSGNLTVATTLTDTDTIQVYGQVNVSPTSFVVGLSIAKLN